MQAPELNYADSFRNQKTSKTPRPVFSPARAIYAGEDRLGHVAPSGSQIAAFDRRGNLVGVFTDVIAAVSAIGGAARVRR